jgi:hypothetical protein
MLKIKKINNQTICDAAKELEKENLYPFQPKLFMGLVLMPLIIKLWLKFSPPRKGLLLIH